MRKIILVLLLICSCFVKAQVRDSKDTIVNGMVNLYAFGFVGNGIEDDSPAWEKALAYASTQRAKSSDIDFPNCISRITRGITIGGNFIEIERMFKRIIYDSLTVSQQQEYQKGVRCANIRILGHTKSSLYADFNDTIKLQAVLFIGGVQGRNGYTQFNVEVSNIGIYAKGYFLNGKGTGKLSYEGNNCAAIVSSYNSGVKLSRVSIFGFKYGEIHNQDTHFENDHGVISYCKQASFDIGSHNSSFINMRTYYCDKGLEIRSNKIFIDRYNASGCRVGLHIAGSDNIINLAYLESCVFTEGQLIVGDEPTDPNAYKGLIEGITFNSLTIAGCFPTRIGILLKSNVKNITINSAAVQSQYVVYNSLSTRIYSQNILGTLPAAILLKPQYLDGAGKLVNN